MRTFAFIAILIAAAGSFGLMLHAARNQPSPLLTTLFTGWVLAPFVAAMWGCSAAKSWKTAMQRALYNITLLVAASSLAVYGAFAMGAVRARTGFIFLVMPAATWLLAGLALAWAALKPR